MVFSRHHLYGSSRLGVAGYWSRQHDAFWNYEANTSDTVRLLDRLPWYSYALNAPMNATTTVEWGNGLSNTMLASHFLGQKQYELTNHLGNVQATVSDKRYVTLRQNESLHFSASVPAVYDYYPFGMPIKERTTRDTATQMTYMTQTIATAGYAYNATAFSGAYGYNSATISTGVNNSIIAYGQTGGIGKVLTGLNPGAPASLVVDVAYIRSTPASITILDANNVQLSNVSINGPGTYTLSFTPTTSSVTISVIPQTSFVNAGNLVIVNSATFTQVNGIIYSPQLVAVSNNVFDKYEFGYNGQLKDNEVAGVGNHNTALFWEYDTRTVFRWNRDPVIIPYLSPYSVFRQNPILFPDIEGDCVGADCDQQSGSVKYKGNPQDSENGAEMEDFVFSVPQTKNKDKSSSTVNGSRDLDNEYVKWLRHEKDGNGDPDEYFEYYQKMRSVENLSTNAFARVHELGYSPFEALAIAVSIPVNGTMAAGGSGSINIVIGQTGFGMGHTVGPSFGTPDASVGLSIGLIQNLESSGDAISIQSYLNGLGNSTTVGAGL